MNKFKILLFMVGIVFACSCSNTSHEKDETPLEPIHIDSTQLDQSNV